MYRIKATLAAGFGLLALQLSSGLASAAIIGFTGSGGFVAQGGVQDATNGFCNPGCDSGFIPFDTVNLLTDGVRVSGLVRQTIVENAFGTQTAVLRVTNIVATNNNAIGTGQTSDTFFFVSDIFDPSPNGKNAGVGISGSYTNTLGLNLGPVPFASTQAQMNYLTVPLNNLGAPIAGFSLTTPATFVSCLACAGIGFFESAFANNVPGGVQQLVGAINFTLDPGSAIVLPGSLIFEEGADEAILSEAPEPATFGMMGTALAGAFFVIRKRRKA